MVQVKSMHTQVFMDWFKMYSSNNTGLKSIKIETNLREGQLAMDLAIFHYIGHTPNIKTFPVPFSHC